MTSHGTPVALDRRQFAFFEDSAALGCIGAARVLKWQPL